MGIYWSGNDTREISFYEYSVGSSPGDTNIISWTDNGSQTQVTIPNFSLTHETVYYANIRAYDMAGNVSTVESSDGIMADLYPPTVGFVYDGLHDDESYTPSDTNLVANWEGFVDTTSGILRYEYAVGTTPEAIDITGDWVSAGENITISASLGLEETITYYFSIRAVDQVNNISPIVSSNGIITDFTGPAGIWVFDGDSVDIEMRVYEGAQATINKILIKGNDRTSDHVIRRELRTIPGQKYNRSELIRTQRELSQLGYFDPESINPCLLYTSDAADE